VWIRSDASRRPSDTFSALGRASSRSRSECPDGPEPKSVASDSAYAMGLATPFALLALADLFANHGHLSGWEGSTYLLPAVPSVLLLVISANVPMSRAGGVLRTGMSRNWS